MSRSARKKTSPAETIGPSRLSPPQWLALRVVLSVLFAAHLLGVFVAPMGMSIGAAYNLFPEKAPRPGEALAADEGQGEKAGEGPEVKNGEEQVEPAIPMPWLNQVYQPYLDVLYLNHGYGFFAPDPGASHLIDYTVDLKDGEQIKGRFPNLDEHWPRLRYHRHFMLAEQIVTDAPEAYARHLLKTHDGVRVRLERIEHVPAEPKDVLDGAKLDDPSSYRSEGTFIVEPGREMIFQRSPEAIIEELVP